MAGESIAEFGDSNDQVAHDLFRQCVTRPPNDDELTSILGYFQQQLERLRGKRSLAVRVLNSGSSVSWKFVIDAAGWSARNDCHLDVSNGSLIIHSTGDDPFIGTNLTAVAGPYTLKIRAKFEVGGVGEVFWTTMHQPSESPQQSVSFDLVANQWHEYRVPFSSDDEIASLRIDTGQSEGQIQIEAIDLVYGDGLYTIAPDTDDDRLAAWMLTARALLNLDETITKP